MSLSLFSNPSTGGRAQYFCAESSKELFFLGLLLLIPFFPYFWTIVRLPYTAYNNSSDTFLYLDIAKNILSGKGGVTSFNVYQYWPGIFYPALPFVQVGLPLVLAALLLVFSTIKALILSQLLLAYLNCFLIFLLVKKIYNERALGYWVALLVASSVSLEITVLRLLTEQLSLFLTLVVLLIFVSKNGDSRRNLGIAAGLLAAGVLVRSASFFYFLAFCLVLGLSKETFVSRIKKIVWFLFCFLTPLILFEFIIYLRYSAFCPQYPQAFKNYYLSTFASGGAFFPGLPAFRPHPTKISFITSWDNIKDMAFVLSCILRVLFLFSLFRLFRIFKKRNREEILLAGLALLQISAVILFYPYMKIGEFQWTRFLLLPVICLAALGTKELKELAWKFLKKTKKIFFHSILAIVFLSNVYQSTKVVEFYWGKDSRYTKAQALSQVAAWVQQNTDKEDLIAVSEYIIGGVYLERPTIILPTYNTLNRKNLRYFLDLYKPKAVIFENTLPIASSLVACGYERATREGERFLFEIFRH